MNPHSPSEDPRRLETVIGAKDFADLYTTSPWKRDFLAAFLEVLEKKFGTKILLRVPDKLAHLHPTIFKNISVVKSLRDVDLLEQINFTNPPPDEPPLLRVYAKGKSSGSGAHFFDPEQALWSALGEMIERSLWFESSEWYENKIKKSSYKELLGEKLDPRSIMGFSDSQKNLNPMLQVTEETPLGWIKAKEWVSGKYVWVPLQLLSAEYCRSHQNSPLYPNNTEPLLRPAVTTGLATSSNNTEEALLYGALEAIERDAFMIFWLNQLSPPRLDQNHLSMQSENIKKIFESLAHYQLDAELLLLPTDFPFFVVSAVIFDETGKGPAFSIGAKAHWNLERAIMGALSEATSVRYSIKNSYKNEVDMSKIRREGRLVYWAKPENAINLHFLRKGKLRKIEIQAENNTPNTELKKLREALRSKGYPLYMAEVSSKASKKAGFYSVYVCSPDLQPMHLDERAPAFGGKRLKEVPSALGYAPLSEVSAAPHPFP